MEILTHESWIDGHEEFINAEEISAADLALEQSTVTSPSKSLVHLQGNMSWVGHVCSPIPDAKKGKERNRMVKHGVIIWLFRGAQLGRMYGAGCPLGPVLSGGRSPRDCRKAPHWNGIQQQIRKIFMDLAVLDTHAKCMWTRFSVECITLPQFVKKHSTCQKSTE